MWDKMDFEVKVGGIFGGIAIIAIIVEMALERFSTLAMVVGIKDFAGTIVSVAVFIFAVKNIFPKKEQQTFEERLQISLNEWQQSHKPIISKRDIAEDSKVRFFMLTDPKHFFDTSEELMSTWKSGWFVKLPELNEKNYKENKPLLLFHLNETTFFEPGTDSETKKRGIEKLISLFTIFVKDKFPELITVTSNTSKSEIIIQFKETIETKEQINELVKVLDCMVQLYLIASNMKL